YLAQAKDSLATLSAFGMLSRLELFIVDGEILLALLLKTPFLKTLVISGIPQFNREVLNSANVPDCLLSTLQVVEIRSVCVDKYVLSLAKFVMENALVLERMSFVVPPWVERSNLEKVKEKLLSVKKGSCFPIVEF
ncbi:FBD domain, partial [Sesbania bispinosa]